MHCKLKVSKNGGMRFVAIDMFGHRYQFSFCRVRKSETVSVSLSRLIHPISILFAALTIMHMGATYF